MGYRLPAEVQTDRIYVERMVMDQSYTMRTPQINRVNDRLPHPDFKALLQEAQSRKNRKAFQKVYNELTGTGKTIDKTI